MVGEWSPSLIDVVVGVEGVYYAHVVVLSSFVREGGNGFI